MVWFGAKLVFVLFWRFGNPRGCAFSIVTSCNDNRCVSMSLDNYIYRLMYIDIGL
jgi:hypothetical protein